MTRYLLVILTAHFATIHREPTRHACLADAHRIERLRGAPQVECLAALPRPHVSLDSEGTKP